MHFEKSSRIAASPERVFAFHESPGALAKLTPPWEKVRVVEGGGSIQVGSRVVLKMAMGPFPMTWVAEHREYAPPHLFADEQVSGPFARWYHRHHFDPDGRGGTILRDVVEFDPPLGTLGRVLAGGFILKKLAKMFEYRHEITRKLVEAGSFPGG